MADAEIDVEEAALAAKLARRRVGFYVTTALALAGAVTLGWYVLLRQPSPETVCANLDALRGTKDGGMIVFWHESQALYGQRAPMTRSWHEKCLWYYQTRREYEDMWTYGPRARCAAGIQNPNHITRCGI